MEKINFDTIANINCSKKENKEEEEKIFLYSDDSDKILLNNQIKNQFRDAFSKMNENLKKLSLNASDIIKEKQFSHKTLVKEYTNIQAFKTEQDFNKMKFKSSRDFDNLFKDNINININFINSNSNNYNNLGNIYKNSDSFKINSKSSNSSGKDKSFKEKKRKRVNSINNENKDETKKLFNDILNICQNISNAQNNLIELKKESAELLNEDNIETTIISGNKEVAKIYLNDNIVKKIYINKSNRTFTEEKEICDSLKKIKRELNKVLNKLTKNK